MTKLEQIAAAFVERGLILWGQQEEDSISFLLPDPLDFFAMNLFFDGYENELNVMVYATCAGSVVLDIWTTDYAPEHILSQAALKILTWERHSRIMHGEEEEKEWY